jgi:hypothetical protein
MRKLNPFECLDYEVNASWLASMLGNKWMQNKMASYLAWKVRRKYRRYIVNKEMKNQLKQYHDNNTKRKLRDTDGMA